MTFPETETHYFSVMGPIPHGIQDIYYIMEFCMFDPFHIFCAAVFIHVHSEYFFYNLVDNAWTRSLTILSATHEERTKRDEIRLHNVCGSLYSLLPLISQQTLYHRHV